MPTPKPPKPRRAGTRLALAVLLVAATAAPGILVRPADAVPPDCPDGGPPPCTGDDDPGPTTTRPRPTSTSTTPAPPPPPPTWRVDFVGLDESGTGAFTGLTAERYWFYPRENAPPNLSVFPPPDSPWGPIPAGTATLDGAGKLDFPVLNPPAGTEAQLLVRSGTGGLLCRTRRGPLPASGTDLHLLAAPPVTTDADDLDAMVAGVPGPVDDLPPEVEAQGVTASVTDASLAPTATGLRLGLVGELHFPNQGWHFTFTYDVVLLLQPDAGFFPGRLFGVELADGGTTGLAFIGPPPPDAEAVINLVKPGLETILPGTVLGRARPLVNSQVQELQAVRWWTEQGFTVVIRSVAYSTSGLTVHAALCRLG